MLYHLTGGPFTDIFLTFLFDFTPTAAVLSLLHGLLPDITIKVGADSEPFVYESRLAQTAFHELGHEVIGESAVTSGGSNKSHRQMAVVHMKAMVVAGKRTMATSGRRAGPIHRHTERANRYLTARR